jgi:hypothetical protein
MVTSPAILGRRILITGDVNSGKTTLSRLMVEALCLDGFGPEIAIVDCAPEVPRQIALARGVSGVGGKLAYPPDMAVLYLADHIAAPRLSTNTEEEAVVVAAANKARIDVLLDRFAASGRQILFINDVTLYLQAGDVRELTNRIAGASTVVANGYRGTRLGTGILSRREAAELTTLSTLFPYHVALPGATPEEVLGL